MSKESEKILKDTNREIFDNKESNGTFIIKNINGKDFWYYILSKEEVEQNIFVFYTEI